MPRKKAKDKVTKDFSIRVDDCGGYWQAYLATASGEMRLGNIYPPGFALFGETTSKDFYVSDRGGGSGDWRLHVSASTALLGLLQDWSATVGRAMEPGA